MVTQSFFATDSENLVVQSSPNAVIVGNPIINNSDTPDGTIFLFTAGGGTTVTLDDNGGDPDVFEDDDSANHIIVDGGGIVANGTPVEAESTILISALDAAGNETGPIITITVLSQNGITGDVFGFATDLPLEDGVSYVKTGGDNIGSIAFTNFITCFANGTMIQTIDGPVPVEQITVGQMVWTQHNGYQMVRWTGSTQVLASGKMAPVVFAPGSINNETQLVVSQEHRMHINTFQCEFLFGQNEILVAAKHLCGLPGVSVRSGGTITYNHLMFDQHEIIMSNGVLSESFFLSETSLSGVTADHKAELLSLFPSLPAAFAEFGPTASLTLRAKEAVVLCSLLNQGHRPDYKLAF